MKFVSLTPRTDFAPVPRVEIRVMEALVLDGGSAVSTGGDVVSGGSAAATSSTVYDGGSAATVTVEIPEATDQITVWRRCEGRQLEVRAGIRRGYTGSFGIQDFEAPPEAESSYELECWSAGSPIARVPVGAAYLPWDGDPEEVILQQPLNPRIHAVVRNMAGSWPSIVRRTPGELVDAQDEYPTYIGSGPQSAIVGMQFDFEVASREESARVWATRGTRAARQLPIWLIRAPRRGLLPAVFFAHVPALEEFDVTVSEYAGQVPAWSRFQGVASEVKPPAPALVGPTLTYSDLKTVFPTYSQTKTALPTYTQMATAWEYAGAAG